MIGLKFKITDKRCHCLPETCKHNEYVIIDGDDGEEWCNFKTLDEAQAFVDYMNSEIMGVHIAKKKVEFISRGQMKRFIETREHLDENMAIISINDTPYEYDEMLELLEGSNFSISMFQDTDDNNGISPLQTMCLLSFIDKNHNKDFLIHCFAGISRSGAIAKFINEYLDRGHMYLEDYMGYNRRVYNSLLVAAGMSLAAYYEELEKQDRMVK